MEECIEVMRIAMRVLVSDPLIRIMCNVREGYEVYAMSSHEHTMIAR